MIDWVRMKFYNKVQIGQIKKLIKNYKVLFVFDYKIMQQKIRQNKMSFKVAWIIWIALSCIKVAKSQVTCQSRRAYLSYFSCTIGYQTCTDQQSGTEQFVLDFCQQKTCISLDCSQYRQVPLDELLCIRNCCDNNSAFQLSLNTLEQCITLNDELSDNRILSVSTIVIICILFGVSFVICLIVFIRNRHRCSCPCFSRQENDQDGVSDGAQYAVQTLEWRNNGESVENLNQLQTSKDFRQPNGQQNSCCICLEVKTNCVTSCQHSFHIVCLKEWIKNKKICPLCTRNNFNPVKVNCQNCHLMWMTFYLTSYPLPNQLLAKTIACDSCSKVPLNQGESNKKAFKQKA